MIVLGIETSCDETAAAVVTGQRQILSNEVLSQLDEHRPYGGVVPEIAARAHLDAIDHIIARAMATANVTYPELDAIAATGGPGLIGGVLVGVMTAKAIAAVHQKPFIGVNHLEGHALTVRLTGDADNNEVEFPYLLLLVSGGHCQLLIVEAAGAYRRLGTTIDDALGEAFDKSAKMLGLGYPGGPALEKWAMDGDPIRFDLPRPLKGRAGCDFSFSGLKTKVRQTIENLPAGPVTDRDKADICAAFQNAAGDVLIDRCNNAIDLFLAAHPAGRHLVVAGGVAANQSIRSRLAALCKARKLSFAAPPLDLCTDNAAMIAWAGLERLKAGDVDDLSFRPRPRWPLDPDAAPAIGGGVKA
ncbi:MAG: tRNA (adenosine(37)-N6)-threonylcarbamoyltransferase complex transferase subunit TsaD [Rhodospirillales bacterium]|nr:tRNA (adenosine(37)-N6)-threonylcarbamoyltransferase complex transferase subunit TsaD [Rhodospirillales bacterium]